MERGEYGRGSRIDSSCCTSVSKDASGALCNGEKSMSAPDTIVATLPRQSAAVHGSTVRPFVSLCYAAVPSSNWTAFLGITI